MNGLQLLKTDRFDEGVAMAAIVRRATEIRHKEMESLANLITSKVVEAWNKGKKAGGQ
jgi:hypothetical protein